MKKSNQEGFSLVETVIAIGVAATVVIPLLALMAVALDGVGDVSKRESAERLVPVVVKKLNSGDFAVPYGWVREKRSLYVFEYRGKPDTFRNDGTPEPYSGEGDANKDYRVTAVARTGDDSALEEDLAALVGPVFRVDLSVSPENSWVTNADEVEMPASVDDFAEAVLFARAEFVESPGGALAPRGEGNPVIERQIAIKR